MGKRQQKRLVKARDKVRTILNKVKPMPNSWLPNAEKIIKDYAEEVRTNLVTQCPNEIEDVFVTVQPETYSPPFQVEFKITYVAESTT